MLGIGCPDRHVLRITHLLSPTIAAENAQRVTPASSRESGFVHRR